MGTLAQWGLHSAALLSPMMVSTSPLLGGMILLAAGIFHLMTDWQEGSRGALLMGLRHGGYCTGCCWFLMAMLFVAGVMNLLWVATITAFVLVEKVAPHGDVVGRIAGLVLVIAVLMLLSQGCG